MHGRGATLCGMTCCCTPGCLLRVVKALLFASRPACRSVAELHGWEGKADSLEVWQLDRVSVDQQRDLLVDRLKAWSCPDSLLAVAACSMDGEPLVPALACGPLVV